MRLLPTLATAVSTAVMAAYAADPVLITVDVSNPAEVTFTATGQSPGITVTQNAFVGMSLLDFWRSNVDYGSGSPGGEGLEASGTAGAYTACVRYGTTLNFYITSGQGVDQKFAIGDPAFTGSATVNLSSISTLLPVAGSSGSLIAGDPMMPEAGVQSIGRWQVSAVPEPHEYALLAGLGLVGFAVWRRRAAR
jgi:MYXO-CTERM domain-containing protein